MKKLSTAEKQSIRMCLLAGQLFRASLETGGKREKLCESHGWTQLPTIIPSLADTLVGDVQETVARKFAAGETEVIVPVLKIEQISAQETKLTVSTLFVSNSPDTAPEWSLNLREARNPVTMEQVVEAAKALHPDRVWSLEELDDDIVSEVKGSCLA